ncbi:hypothetical protein BpHYR1_002943, partial [Brachionus plicatilis]
MLKIKNYYRTKSYSTIFFMYPKSLRLVWYTRAMAAISTSKETLNVVKKALSKHANPVPCEIYGELMKNIKG